MDWDTFIATFWRGSGSLGCMLPGEDAIISGLSTLFEAMERELEAAYQRGSSAANK